MKRSFYLNPMRLLYSCALLFFLGCMTLTLNACDKNDDDNGDNDDDDKVWVDNTPILEFREAAFLEAAITEHADRNGDGKVSEKEASLVGSLTINDSNVRSTEDLRFFPELETFQFQFNPNVSVIDLSHNPKLRELDCAHTAITKLDLSHNPDVRALLCVSNQLEEINVSACPELIALSCDLNPNLQELNLQKNTKITDLLCSGCGLFVLDLSKCEALANLRCDDNNLTSLDLSNNRQLSKLGVSENQLIELTLWSGHKKQLEPSVIEGITQEYGDIISYVD